MRDKGVLVGSKLCDVNILSTWNWMRTWQEKKGWWRLPGVAKVATKHG